MENSLGLGLRAGHVASIGHADAQCPTEKAAEMGEWMCQLVFFIVPILEVDKYTKVVCTRSNSNTSPSKLCAELVVPTRTYSLLCTIDPERGDRWMMRGLLCKVTELESLSFCTRSVDERLLACLPKDWRECVFDVPVTLASMSMPYISRAV